MQKRILDWYKSVLGESWYNELEPFLLSEDMEKIRLSTLATRKRTEVFPSAENMFRAFTLTPFDEVRVIIQGQDPYHTPGYANGLAFSSAKEYPLPPSLSNILSELETDIVQGLDFDYERRHDLSGWATQGVLMINSAFTVEKGVPGSHMELWKPFTEFVYKCLREKTGLIYVLWGKHAQEYKKFINTEANFIMESPHPSPFSARTGFFGSKPFSKVNDIIVEQNGADYKIDWLKL